MKETIAVNAVEQNSQFLINLAQKIWNHPETAYDEVDACRWTAEALREKGFEVEVGYAGLPTAIRATWGKGHPVVGFLGEYDALPGMSQKICTEKDPVEYGAPGQGCGHNLLGVACLGGALGMKAELEERGLEGTVVYYGCPAEEELTGKTFMARNGAFTDLDVALAWHGSTHNSVNVGTMTGLNSAVFHFHGITAHAGGDPYNGRSALDAVELMNVGSNYLREHVTSDVRIHYVIKEGGTAPNIVPDNASVWYYVRATERENVEDTYRRLVLIAEGAAHMTETKLEIEFLGGCYNTLGNRVLANICHECMEEIPLPQWTQEELAFAEALNLASPQYEKMKAAGLLDGPSLCSEVPPVSCSNGYGSTDVGDVEHIVPGIMINTASWNLAAPSHSWQVTACSGMGIGEKGMLYGAKVLAAAAVKLSENPELVKQAKEEFDEAMKGKSYRCPIPKEIPVPQPKH